MNETRFVVLKWEWHMLFLGEAIGNGSKQDVKWKKCCKFLYESKIALWYFTITWSIPHLGWQIKNTCCLHGGQETYPCKKGSHF
jgi:hypothetical protein